VAQKRVLLRHRGRCQELMPDRYFPRRGKVPRRSLSVMRSPNPTIARVVLRHDLSRRLSPELFHHHQRVKICALNPEGTRHHAVRLEAELPVKLPATWIVDCDI